MMSNVIPKKQKIKLNYNFPLHDMKMLESNEISWQKSIADFESISLKLPDASSIKYTVNMLQSQTSTKIVKWSNFETDSVILNSILSPINSAAQHTKCWI